MAARHRSLVALSGARQPMRASHILLRKVQSLGGGGGCVHAAMVTSSNGCGGTWARPACLQPLVVLAPSTSGGFPAWVASRAQPGRRARAMGAAACLCPLCRVWAGQAGCGQARLGGALHGAPHGLTTPCAGALWWGSHPIYRVFPPCDTRDLQRLPLDRWGCAYGIRVGVGVGVGCANGICVWVEVGG